MELVQGKPTSEAEFIWWFERNPNGYLNIYLAEDAGRLVAVSSTNSFRIWLDGREHLVPFPLNVLTHPDYRGKGIFSALESACEDDALRRGCPFMLSFPNALSGPIFVSRLGWSSGQVAPLMVKVLRPSSILGAAFGRAGTRPWPEQGAQHHAAGVELEPIERFGPEYDELWSRVRDQSRWSLVRDARHLNWRYVDAPSRRYRCLRIGPAEAPAGYLVTGVTHKRGLRLGYIADLLLAPGSHGLTSVALAAADEALRGQDIDAMLCFSPPAWSDWWRRLGCFYVPTPKRFRFIHKALDPAFSQVPLGDPHRWQFELGDLDFF